MWLIANIQEITRGRGDDGRGRGRGRGRGDGGGAYRHGPDLVGKP